VLLLAMLVVGGMRSVSGAVVGTVLITVGNEIFRQLGDPQRLDVERLPDLFLGVVLLAVMLLRPGGLLGDTDLVDWLRRRARRAPATAEAPPADDVAPPVPSASATLEASGIIVRFGGFVALDGPAIRVRPGEIVGLIGPNGAGKTTLFNVLTGLVHADAGSVLLGDRELLGEPPHRIAQAGLARTFQNLRVFRSLSVHENVALAAESARRTRSHRPAVDVDDLLERSGLASLADRRASTLDYGNLRRLELARAAAMAPDFLLLDEPTSGMSDDESAAMVERVRSMAEHVGAGVVVIDHDLAFITRISDHIVALSEGVVIAEGAPDEVRRDPGVVAAYLGSAADDPPA
jgi:branched-chain amino acid transport system permease protein